MFRAGVRARAHSIGALWFLTLTLALTLTTASVNFGSWRASKMAFAARGMALGSCLRLQMQASDGVMQLGGGPVMAIMGSRGWGLGWG